MLTWNDVDRGIKKLSKIIIENGYYPELIVGIFRNGWIIARILADYIGIDEVSGIGIKFYKSIGEVRERPLLTIPPTISVRDRRILIVDDVSDSGRTLQTAIEASKLYGAKEVRTACLYVKSRTLLVPDYYCCKSDEWIVFPWEYGEVVRELSQKLYGSLNEETIKKVVSSLGIKDPEFADHLYRLEVMKNKMSYKER